MPIVCVHLPHYTRTEAGSQYRRIEHTSSCVRGRPAIGREGIPLSDRDLRHEHGRQSEPEGGHPRGTARKLTLSRNSAPGSRGGPRKLTPGRLRRRLPIHGAALPTRRAASPTAEVAPDRPQIHPDSAPYRPHVDPGSTQDRNHREECSTRRLYGGRPRRRRSLPPSARSHGVVVVVVVRFG